MLFSLTLILVIGFSLSGIFQKLKLPGLIGMILCGMILGPHAFNLISPDLLNISSQLKQIALIVILTRVGLSLDINDLKKVGRSALLMCFVPATFEILAVTLIAPVIFHISYLEAAIMGCVLAAVSPAVVVPRMLNLMDNGYGKKNNIPQIIMAGTSVDGIYVIILFTSFLGLYEGGAVNLTTFANIPLAIILGVGLGILSGIILTIVFKKIHMRDTIKMFLILSCAFAFVTLEAFLKGVVPISGLLSVMALSCTLLNRYKVVATRLSSKFFKLWVGFELLLFVLVGASVDIGYLSSAGFKTVILILFALVFRVCGVFVCLLKTDLSFKERLFCAISYLPKATVQAAIGSLPLVAGVGAGNTILTVAVLAILLTAPLGAIGVDLTYETLLESKTES
ncbi:cation:proton antiporter [Romboutsia sp.]|uniref:cation:proton antiporter n=1 Tax=Romboutsia sp. TaxID=1965302 RepID=UPI003F38C5F7